MAQDEIGKAKIVVEADISGVKESVTEAKSEVEGLGNEADASGKKASGAMKGFGGAVDSVATKLGKATGILAAFAAATTGIVKAYQAIAEYVRNGETVAELFTADLDTINATEAALGKINQRLIEVGAELEAKEAGGIGSLLGRRRGQIEEELEALRSRQQSVSKQLRRQRETELRETAQDFIRQAEAIQESIGISLLPTEEQIAANAEVQKRQLIKAAEEARVEIDNAALQSTLNAIDRKAKAEIEAERKVVAERERLENERIQKQAEREAKILAQAIERELSTVFAALTSSFGTGFTTQLSTITDKIDDATREIRKTRR